MDQSVLKVKEVSQGFQVKEETRDRKVLLDCAENLVHLGLQAIKVSVVELGHQDHPDQTGQTANQDLKDRQAKMESLDCKEGMEKEARLVRLDHQVLLDHQDFWV